MEFRGVVVDPRDSAQPLTDRARQEVTCVSAARSEVHIPSARWSLPARV